MFIDHHDPRIDAALGFPADMPEPVRESFRLVYLKGYYEGVDYELERERHFWQMHWDRKRTLTRIFTALNLIAVGLSVGYVLGSEYPTSWGWVQYPVWIAIVCNVVFAIRDAIIQERGRRKRKAAYERG